MRLSSLWEMSYFSYLAVKGYISTQKSFDSLGEDYSDPDSWYTQMLLLQGDKLVSQKLWQAALHLPQEYECCFTNFYLFYLFDRISQRHGGMPGTEAEKIKQKSKPSGHTPLLSFPNSIKDKNISRGLFFYHFQPSPPKKLFSSPILNTRLISRCFQIPQRRRAGAGHLQLSPYLGNLPHSQI